MAALLIVLIDPVIWFFVLGLAGGFLKSDLRLPRPFLEALTIFLLLALGLKGGVELAKHHVSTLIGPGLALVALSLALTAIAYGALRAFGRFSRPDAAAIAAHYGSVSVITFAVAQAFLTQRDIVFSPHMTVYLVLLEIPALLAGAFIGRTRDSKTLSWGAFAHELVFGKTFLLLIGGLAIGYASGPDGIAPLKPLFFDLFKPVVAFFLLELGVAAAAQAAGLKRSGVFLALFGVAFPMVAAALGALVGALLGFSEGDTLLAAVLAASASYIAAPASMRVALPQANVAIALAPVLAVTFPFNLIVGFPIYLEFARLARRALGA